MKSYACIVCKHSILLHPVTLSVFSFLVLLLSHFQSYSLSLIPSISPPSPTHQSSVLSFSLSFSFGPHLYLTFLFFSYHLFLQSVIRPWLGSMWRWYAYFLLVILILRCPSANAILIFVRTLHQEVNMSHRWFVNSTHPPCDVITNRKQVQYFTKWNISRWIYDYKSTIIMRRIWKGFIWSNY